MWPFPCTNKKKLEPCHFFLKRYKHFYPPPIKALFGDFSLSFSQIKMATANTTSNHLIVLSQLCRICGHLLDKKSKWNNFTITEELAERIKTNIFLETSSDSSDLHPKQICLKCYSALKNVEKRGSSHTLHFFEFTSHSEINCLVCERANNLIQLRPLRKTKRSPGRPKSSTPKIWTKNQSVKLIEKTEDPVPEEIKTTWLKTDHLPKGALDCLICNELMKRPVTTAPCDHSFCVLCILKIIEGSILEKMECPQCKGTITSIFPSTHICGLIKSLKAVCSTCEENFPLKDYKNHPCKSDISKAKPIVHSPTLKDMFNVRNDTEITPDMNDAVVHILRTKMESSPHHTNIKFKTGGKVSNYQIIILWIISIWILTAYFRNCL